MTLPPGTRLGPYDLVAPLGAGGMGQVYRARDTRLGRDVAVKVIGTATATSQDAVARFEREGRAIAALNHPNICTLFDVGAADGHPYLVMELLEGSTLHDVVAQGPIPVAGVIDHGIALADALHTAHARGIVHRDLKPANVFVTARGALKILDFGLAKADLSGGDETRLSDRALTGPGMTLGTAAYMSPEQLRGEAIDARTDLFSLGLVLYEMAAGRRAFDGKTGAEVAAAILHAAPAHPRSVRPELPEKLAEIILKALEKDRELRYQSAAELRGDLKRLRREGGESAAPQGSPTPPMTPTRPIPPASSDAALAVGLLRRHPRAAAGAALVAIVAVLAVWWAIARPARTNADVAEVLLQPLTFHGQAGDATISGDGRFIAYVREIGTESSVVVKQLSSDSDVVILPPRAGVSYYAPSVTPDGGYVDVLEVELLPTVKTRVVRLPFLGGAPRQLLGDGVRSGIGWSPDGRRMAFNRSDGPGENSIVIADPQGQKATVLVTRRAPSFFVNVTFGRRAARPSWSPDGRSIAVVGVNNAHTSISRGELVEIAADTGTERVVHRFESASEVAYLDQDRWVVSTLTASVESQQWQLFPRTGSPVALTRDLGFLQGVQLTADRSSGVAVRATPRSAIAVGTIAGAEFVDVVGESGAMPASPAVDGAGNLFYGARVSDGVAIFRQAGRDSTSTMVAPNMFVPRPSPDGTFVVGRRLNAGLVRANADGSDARVILEDASAIPLVITRDNATLVYQSNRDGHQQPWQLALGTGVTRRLSDYSIGSRTAWLSPDERQVIFAALGGPSRGPTLCAFPSFDDCRSVKVIPGPFSADGKSVFAIDPADPANIIVQPLDGSARTPLTRFTDKRIVDFSVTPDGTRMAITRGMAISDVVLVKGLK